MFISAITNKLAYAQPSMKRALAAQNPATKPVPDDSFTKNSQGICAAQDIFEATANTCQKKPQYPPGFMISAKETKAILDAADKKTRKALLLTPDIYGFLPIHLSVAQTTKVILDAADEKTRKAMLLAPDKFGLLPVHHAATMKRVETMQILLDAADEETRKEMLLTPNAYGTLPIHWSNNAEVAKVILDAVDEETKKEMLLARNKHDNIPVQQYNTEVAMVIFNAAFDLGVKTKDVNLLKSYQEYIPKNNAELQKKFSTAIASLQNQNHTTRPTPCNTERLQTASPKYTRSELMKPDKDGRLLIHWSNNAETTTAILDSADERTRKTMLLTKNKDGNLPVHLSRDAEMTKAMLDSVDERTRKAMLLTKNKDGNLPVHLSRDAEMTKAMLDSVDKRTRKAMLLTPGMRGNLPVHDAATMKNAETMQVMLDSVDERTRKAMLLTPNAFSNLPIHRPRNAEVTKAILNAVDEATRRTMLLTPGKDGALPIHWPRNAEVAKVILDAVDEVTRRTMLLACDREGNIPIHSCGGTYINDIDSSGVSIDEINNSTYVEIIKVMLDAADEETRRTILLAEDEDGDLPITSAFTDNIQKARVLLEAALNLGIKTKDVYLLESYQSEIPKGDKLQKKFSSAMGSLQG